MGASLTAMLEQERRRLIRASDRLIAQIEDWRLIDNPARPVPPGWIAFYHAQLGGTRASFADVDDLHCELFHLQGGWLKGGPDEEPAVGRPSLMGWLDAG